MNSFFSHLDDSTFALRVDAQCETAPAAALAERLGIPLLTQEATSTFFLHWRPQGLELRKSGDKNLKGALRVDFCTPAMQRRLVHCHQELVVRAAKIKHLQESLLIDATAGLGLDGFLLAAAGFHVHMIERHPVVAALLRDGLERAAHNPKTARITERITLIEGDALSFLTALEIPPAVIYLDPMFPSRVKSAKVKRSAQFLQYLAHSDPAQESMLLHTALALRPRRVVFKRPLKTAQTTLSAPSYIIKGKSVRYEVYSIN